VWLQFDAAIGLRKGGSFGHASLSRRPHRQLNSCKCGCQIG
jgi:hypothetical protein